MKLIEPKYAFPLFTHKEETRYLLGNKNKVLVSDIWSFWVFIIEQRSKKMKKEQTPFLLSLLDQAKYFYQAAETAPINSQPLLYYYSFLNLGKIIISMSGELGDNPSQKCFHHGIETNPLGKRFSEFKVTIKKMNGSDKISVGYSLMKYFGDATLSDNSPTEINILEAMGNCLGIHRAYCLVKNQKEEHFVKVVNYEICRVGKELMARLQLKESNSSLTSLYTNIKDEISEESINYFWEEKITMSSYRPTRSDYYKLSQALLKKGIWTYTDGEDYIMYLSSNSQTRFSTASLIYCLMFFFGSITRYHPHLFEMYLSKKYNWLIAEFLKTQPMQFLYIATSLVTESYITMPNDSRLLI